MASTLEIKDLHVSIEDKEILKGVNLTINTDEIHAIMGTKRGQVNQLYHLQLWDTQAMK